MLVAIKQPKNGWLDDFAGEVAIMDQLQQLGMHANLVCAIGVVESPHEPMLALELCVLGSLRDLLRKEADQGAPANVEEMVRFCDHVASAMAFVEPHGTHIWTLPCISHMTSSALATTGPLCTACHLLLQHGPRAAHRVFDVCCATIATARAYTHTQVSCTATWPHGTSW